MTNPSTEFEVSAIRRWIMRIPFFFTGVLFTFTAWGTLIEHWGTFEPIEGVAFAFWGALSLLAIIGLRFPVKMLPILLLQFGYKLLWIAAVGYPLMSRGELDSSGQDLFQANAMGVVIDLIAIPWIYVIRTYVVEGFSRRDKDSE
ncbi:hypothetical protein [Sphingorhabdus sp. Alg231-15]|uniref:hypothetical protein n=1 Tax=Sphingorhabdus sp. Alg231-15 TaxID=1922222 RepID=UPI000D55B20F